MRVVHCDLKPSNVLLDDDMTAVVADFGISQLVKDVGDTDFGGNSGDPCNSITGLLQGSVGYIAPGTVRLHHIYLFIYMYIYPFIYQVYTKQS